MNEQWTINKTKKGTTYTLRFHYGRDEKGAYKWKKITAKTKLEARKLKEEFELKTGIASSNLLLKQSLYSYIKNWGELYYKSTVQEQTYAGFLNAVENRIKPYPIASMQMISLSIDLLQHYINELIEAKYSRDTICKTWRYINMCLQYGIEKGELTNIPLRLVKMPTEANVLTKKKEVIPFSSSDIEKIKNEAAKTLSNGRPKYAYGNTILLLLNTGLRIGEILALTWNDIDFENKLIFVDKSYKTYQDKSENAIKKTKGVIGNTKNCRKRTVAINKTAEAILLKIKGQNVGHTSKSDRVILSTKFTVPSSRNINRCLEEITKNAGTELQTSGVHRLRHTYATMFLNKKMPIEFISNQLGHAKISTTQDIYVSYLDDTFQKDKKIFEKF